jgi:RNA recognition motif-containing protein
MPFSIGIFFTILAEIKNSCMNIYIAKIKFQATESDLKELFGAYGTVTSAKIISDRETGKSKGFGFVEMSKEEGDVAIAALNGYSFMGMQLVVNEARPQK